VRRDLAHKYIFKNVIREKDIPLVSYILVENSKSVKKIQKKKISLNLFFKLESRKILRVKF